MAATPALCVYCHEERGRRSCPALGGLICPSCCGRHRGVEVDCPPHCKHFREHEEYRRQRLGSLFHQAWLEAASPFYRAGRRALLNFLAFLELEIYRFFVEQTRGTDEQLVEALEYTKQKLGPIELIEAPPASPLSRHLWEAVRKYVQERGDALAPEDAQTAVEVLLAAVRALQQDGEPRQALHGLLGHVEQFLGVPEELKAKSAESLIETPKILRPGEF